MPRGSDISPLSLLLGRVDAVADGAAPTDTVPSGFPSLDKLLGGGLRRGDLVVLGGDVGSGKSALALAIALRVAQAERSVALLLRRDARGARARARSRDRGAHADRRPAARNARRGDTRRRRRRGDPAARRAADHRARPAPAGIAAIADEVRRSATSSSVVIDGLDALAARSARHRGRRSGAAIRALKQLALDARRRRPRDRSPPLPRRRATTVARCSTTSARAAR